MLPSMAGSGGHPPLITNSNALFALRRLPKLGNLLRSVNRESAERRALEESIAEASQRQLVAIEELLVAETETRVSSAVAPEVCNQDPEPGYQALNLGDRPEPPADDEYITKAVAVERSGRSSRWLRELASDGRIRKRLVPDPMNRNRTLALFHADDIARLRTLRRPAAETETAEPAV